MCTLHVYLYYVHVHVEYTCSVYKKLIIDFDTIQKTKYSKTDINIINTSKGNQLVHEPSSIFFLFRNFFFPCCRVVWTFFNTVLVSLALSSSDDITNESTAWVLTELGILDSMSLCFGSFVDAWRSEDGNLGPVCDKQTTSWRDISKSVSLFWLVKSQGKHTPFSSKAASGSSPLSTLSVIDWSNFSAYRERDVYCNTVKPVYSGHSLETVAIIEVAQLYNTFNMKVIYGSYRGDLLIQMAVMDRFHCTLFNQTAPLLSHFSGDFCHTFIRFSR